MNCTLDLVFKSFWVSITLTDASQERQSHFSAFDERCYEGIFVGFSVLLM
jgi:hypothetical protein